MDCIELWESVHIANFLQISFDVTFIADILAVWIKVSSDKTPLLVTSLNTAEKPTFLPKLFDPSVYAYLVFLFLFFL